MKIKWQIPWAIPVLFFLLSSQCNSGKDLKIHSEEMIKAELKGGWVVSTYCRILERTRSPLAAREAFNDYHQIIYAPDRKFSFSQSDSSYWIFLDSAQGVRADGFPIRFDLEKSIVVVLTGNLKDTLAILEPNYRGNPDRLLLIKPIHDILIFHRSEKDFEWGSPTDRYTNKVVLSGIFYPILEGIPDTTKPIRFEERGKSRDFSEFVGSPTQYIFYIVHLFGIQDSTDLMIIRNPESKIGRVFESRFGIDTLKFSEVQPLPTAGRKTCVLVRARR
ncbi:MAG: hypothetical protein JF616_13685 [Fibrobacteres bacterium]|nr:hypothetical protein [Fibrobacterota bacterium]